VLLENVLSLATALARGQARRVNSLRGEPLAFSRRPSRMWCLLLALVACGEGAANRRHDGVASLSAERATSSPLFEGTAAAVNTERRVSLRLPNSSDVEFDWVQVWGPQGEVAYQLLPAHAESEYVRFDAYPLSNLHANSGQTRYAHRVRDFAESPLGDGYYTYVLSVLPPPVAGREGALALRLARDDSAADTGH
jgi:hypothetical protein